MRHGEGVRLSETGCGGTALGSWWREERMAWRWVRELELEGRGRVGVTVGQGGEVWSAG